MHRVLYYDNNHKLICWYSTPKKLEAERLVTKTRHWYSKLEEITNA